MQAFVQLIETYWTKHSRGSPGSQVRNRVPLIHHFPDIVPVEDVLFQHVGYSEYTSFAKATVSPVAMLSIDHTREWRITIAFNQGVAEVSFWGVPDSESSGKPVSISRLLENNWMRIVGNRRTPEESGWAYRKYVYNVFYGDVSNANELVASNPPLYLLNYERHLW